MSTIGRQRKKALRRLRHVVGYELQVNTGYLWNALKDNKVQTIDNRKVGLMSGGIDCGTKAYFLNQDGLHELKGSHETNS